MKKTLPLMLATSLFAAQAFASYIVILRDGTQYKAKAKWTMANGKAIVQLETGQSLAIDPALIDAARSEQATRDGLGDAHQIDLDPNMPEASAPKAQAPSLGSRIGRLRTPASSQSAPAPASAPPPTTPSRAAAARTAPGPAPTPPSAPAGGGGAITPEVVEKFERAYENVGIFEHKLNISGSRTIHVELTADSEDKVFNAISATSFLMVRNAGVSGVQVDKVELFMRTTTGGSAGRFEMTRADAEALDAHSMTQQDYFVRRVIY